VGEARAALSHISSNFLHYRPLLFACWSVAWPIAAPKNLHKPFSSSLIFLKTNFLLGEQLSLRTVISHVGQIKGRERDQL
jgi:hypothetical protein